MPRLQSANDTAIVSEYISCIKKKGNPRMHYKICNKCLHNKKCGHYKEFKLERPDLYPVVKK
jgi:hypothetical protein